MRYKVICELLNEVKCETNDLGEAVREAVDWAIEDDVMMVVHESDVVNGYELFRVDGYAVAVELEMMFSPDEE